MGETFHVLTVHLNFRRGITEPIDLTETDLGTFILLTRTEPLYISSLILLLSPLPRNTPNPGYNS